GFSFIRCFATRIRRNSRVVCTKTRSYPQTVVVGTKAHSVTRTTREIKTDLHEQKGEMVIPKDKTMKEITMSTEIGMNGRGGHLYMTHNEVKNAIIRSHRSANGTLTEVERVATGGAGSGTFKPISGQESAPNSFEGAGSVILSPDHKFLFATNGGDNSV